MATSDSFDTFLNRAWAQHADEPEAWAARLQTETPAPGSASQLLALVRFTVHLLGEHLGRYDDARWRLKALVGHAQADAQVHAALRIAAASLSLAEHGSAAIAVFSAQQQTQALAQAAAIAVGQRHIVRALALLARARQTLPSDGQTSAAAHRPLAVACNNMAWELHDRGAQRSPAETEAMLDIAQASRTHWREAGGWLEVQRADYCLALVHLSAGQPEAAAAFAQACLQSCEAHEAPAFERFFAHEASARVALTQQRAASLQAHVLHARAAFERLEANDRDACRSAWTSLQGLAMQAA
jgi:HEPN domain-containing protein